MIQSKKIGIITAFAICIALIIAIVLMGLSEEVAATASVSEVQQYTTELFGTNIISVEILADKEQWQEMLENAASEQYIMVDVTVNGTEFKNVGIRPKGNSSLTHVAGSDSNRYSFRLQFDKYTEGQTCFGLQSFVVNNLQGDNTYMKEYVSYDLMKEAGVACPCYGYADIKLNGEAWGLYLAVELYNDSYEQRVYGTTEGMLYNVKTMEMGGGDDSTHSFSGGSPPDREERRQERDVNGERPSSGGMGGGRDNNGGSLVYTDDSLTSYSAIFDNVVGKGSDTDYQKVIAVLKALSEGRDLEIYFDVDQILRYLAAHTIVVNLDSYSSSMAQNYYLYEKDGQITVLPWDYNLAWGGFQSGDALSVINFPIDTPVSGVEMSARPLLEKLFENEEYLEQYHSYLQMLLDNYFANGQFEIKINQLNTLIESYVEKDSTAFCTPEEYQKAAAAFVTLGNLRAESVQGQLNGEIPSTSAEQTENSDALILPEKFNLQDLGSGMGGEKGERKKGDSNMVLPQTNHTPLLSVLGLILLIAGSTFFVARCKRCY